ncbi:hypothetical protein [Reichenbachiella sp. MALMAid0571]|uniref:hypothetical protein n=1 Tax=Reichenbachiella sp. MALMAid0571 TaxID=3143939 RepID=UPI0032DED884
MITTSLDYKSGKLFPIQFQFFGGVLLLIGVSVATNSIVVGLILILVAASILTGQSGIDFDSELQTYREYKSFLFVKSGNKKKYSGVEKIFINSQTTSQRMYTMHTSHSSNFKNREFNAYLKFDNGNKIYLNTNKDKIVLMDNLRKLAGFLKTDVVDTTV